MRLSDYLDKGASLGPDAPCLTTDGETRSYAEVQELSRRIAAALARQGIGTGDTVALRLCLERILPPRRERPVRFRLPALQSPADAISAMAAITAAVADAGLTPGEAAELSKLIDAYVRAVEVTEFDQRLRALEMNVDAKGP